jgi:hypothetical protein
MKKVWDQMGITISSVCVIHCLVVAFLPLLFPAFSLYSHQPWIHIIVGLLVLITTPMAFLPGMKKHGLNWIMGLAMAGLILIMIGVYLEKFHDSEQLSHGISIFGSLLLVSAHLKNIQHSNKHHHQCC